MADLFIKTKDGSKGPFSPDKIVAYIQQRRINADVLISGDNKNWIRVCKHPLFQNHFIIKNGNGAQPTQRSARPGSGRSPAVSAESTFGYDSAIMAQQDNARISNAGNSSASNRLAPKVHQPTSRKSLVRSVVNVVNRLTNRATPSPPLKDVKQLQKRNRRSVIVAVIVTIVVVLGIEFIVFRFVLPKEAIDSIETILNSQPTIDDIKKRLREAEFDRYGCLLSEADLLSKVGQPAQISFTLGGDGIFEWECSDGSVSIQVMDITFDGNLDGKSKGSGGMLFKNFRGEYRK